MDRGKLEKLIQEYGKSMYKAGFKDGFICLDNVHINSDNDTTAKPSDLFNKISDLIETR